MEKRTTEKPTSADGANIPGRCFFDPEYTRRPSEWQIKKAYSRNQFLREMATELNMSIYWTYVHIKALGLAAHNAPGKAPIQLTDEKLKIVFSFDISTSDAAKAIGTSNSFVYLLRRSSPLYQMRETVSDAQLVSSHAMGGTEKEIGERVGITRQAVSRRLHKLGLEPYNKPHYVRVAKDAQEHPVIQKVTRENLARMLRVNLQTVENKPKTLGPEPNAKGQKRQAKREKEKEKSAL